MTFSKKPVPQKLKPSQLKPPKSKQPTLKETLVVSIQAQKEPYLHEIDGFTTDRDGRSYEGMPSAEGNDD